MKIKELKEMLEKLPEDNEVLVAEYMSTCGTISIHSYDEPNMNTFVSYDGTLLIRGYDDKSCFDYKRRIINSESVEQNAKSIS